MRALTVLVVLSFLSFLPVTSSADVFHLGPGLTNLETVPVGDPGNAGELSGEGTAPDRICGSVNYTYGIAKYEVTTAQYTDFLNRVAATDTYGLYNAYMGDPATYSGCNIQRSGSSGSYTYSVAADWANRPVNYVSFWDSVRFANWLHNGQPAGSQDLTTTEDGAYFINGYNGSDGRTVQRKTNWNWAVTSEDEWYKAAYYKGGTSNAYWEYPTQSETSPGRDMADVSGNNANYYNLGFLIGSPYYRTQAGEFENSQSHYGTFDQGGNVWEWNEAITMTVDVVNGITYQGMRGGSFNMGGEPYYFRASVRDDSYMPLYESRSVGFRVSAVPEPSSLFALGSGLVALAGLIRRRR